MFECYIPGQYITVIFITSSRVTIQPITVNNTSNDITMCFIVLAANQTYVDECDGYIDTSMSRWLPVFCLAQIIYSYAGTSLWVIGIAWIDENVKYENSTLYMG